MTASSRTGTDRRPFVGLGRLRLAPYRLHSLTRPTPVTWTALHGQFGAGFKAIRQLKPTFRDALTLALAVYPEARVDLEGNGLVLHPSPPAVPRAEAKRIGLG